jgi:hypothetical protein
MTDRPATLGIDFGTSHTVAVLARPGVETLLFDASPLLASGVFAEADGRLLVGRDAQRSARLTPQAFEPDPKRRIDDSTLLLGASEVPVAAAGLIAAAVFPASGGAALLLLALTVTAAPAATITAWECLRHRETLCA